jgi:integrase/recombinase XerD
MPWDFEQFIKERKYLHNVSPRTIEWYEQTFKWLGKFEPTEAGCKAFVIGMREGGLKAISCNSRIRVANAYFKWAELPLHINRLKEEQRQLPTFTPDQLGRLISFRPKGSYQHRLYTLVMTLLDTGTRIDEALSLSVREVDMDNLILTVKGKGDKERKIPFSFELRKTIFRYLKLHDSDLLFCTRDGHRLGRRDVLRDFKLLCRKLGFEPPPRTLHAIRHTFATEYIRRGGSQFMLMKVLGHTSLEMTKKYVNFQTDDLQAVHNRLSPLSARH